MKKIIFTIISFVLLLLFSISVMAEEKNYSEIFEKDSIIDIKINIDDADLKDMRDYPQNEEYHTADITVDGIKVENMGIRTKGNMTLNSISKMDSDRYSYRVKFNKYVKGQKLLGLNELCLNSGYSDASYMREYLHYEIMREMGVKVPETVFCNLYINDEFAGFYLAVEALDSSFVETKFDDPNEEGNLYKMEEGANLVYKSDENYTYADLKVGSDKEMKGLKSFIKALNEMPEGEKGDIEKYLNIESALKYIAANTVLSNYDSYNGGLCHNYYLYEDKNGIFTVVPWNFNMSFGGNGGDTSIGIDTPTNGRNMDSLPLINNLLAVPEYKEMYYGYIKEMMAILENFEDRVNELKTIIKPYVENDTTAFYSIDEFEKATSKSTEKSAVVVDEKKETTEEGRGHGPDFGNSKSIVDSVADRLANLNAQFNGTAEKTTNTDNGFGGDAPKGAFGEHNGNERPDGMQNNGEPPENMQPPNDFMAPKDMNNNMPNFENADNSLRAPKNDNFGRQNENNNIRVHIDGHIITFSENPILNDGTTLVGYRAIMEALGAEVTWDNGTKSVTATKDDINIVITINSDTAYVNGKKETLLEVPKIINGNTMIPVRFVSEQLGMQVEWDQSSKFIEITSK